MDATGQGSRVGGGLSFGCLGSGWRDWWGWSDRGAAHGSVAFAERVVAGQVRSVVHNERSGTRTMEVMAGDEAGVPHCFVKQTTCGWFYGLRHFSQPQAWRVAWTMRRMRRRGLGVPGVRLAATRLRGGRFENVLVLDAVDGRPFMDVLLLTDASAYASGSAAVAGEVAGLHAACFAHGDLVPGNLLLVSKKDGGAAPLEMGAGEASLVFIDNDRTRRVPWFWMMRVRCRNMSQLLHRIRLARGWPAARQFFGLYCEAAGLSSGATRWLRWQVATRVRKRFDPDKAAEARRVRAARIVEAAARGEGLGASASASAT